MLLRILLSYQHSQVLFLSIVYLLSSGDPPSHTLVQISSVSKSLLAALKDKGKHPTMLLSGESGSNKKNYLLLYCLIGMDNNFLKIKLWDPTPSPPRPQYWKCQEKKAAIVTNPREYTINEWMIHQSFYLGSVCELLHSNYDDLAITMDMYLVVSPYLIIIYFFF